MAAVPAFIESPFSTRKEYLQWCALPDGERKAALTVKLHPTASVSFSVRFTGDAIRSALARAGWTVCHDSEVVTPTLYWSDFAAIPWDEVLDGRATASAQYLKTGIVRKADLLHYMTKHGGGSHFPTTLIGDIEEADDVDELVEQWKAACTDSIRSAQSAGSAWLLKPSRANRGEGIALIVDRDVDALRAAIAAWPSHRDWLLQSYVMPLLLSHSPHTPPLSCAAQQPSQGLKCHLRLHVLAVGALSVWVHDAPLVLLASQEWAMPTRSAIAGRSEDDDQQLLAHLTNHAQQARSTTYDEGSHTRRLREAFGPSLAASLLEQARGIASDVFKPFARGTAACFPLPHCFELYGIDVAVDSSGRARLLEVNSGPDLSLHGNRLRGDADALLDDVLSVVTRHLYRGRPSAANVLDSADPATSAAYEGEVMGGFTCVRSRRCDEPREELLRFRRSLATVGKFAHALHEAAGAPVRGLQGAVAARREAANRYSDAREQNTPR